MNKKRLIAAVSAAACFASTFAVFPEKVGMQSMAVEAVNNNFEVSYEGWYGNDDYAELTAVEGAGYAGSRGMILTGRTTPEAGAASSKGFYLWGGVKYDYSVKVKADTDEVFHISLLYKDEETDAETTVELASKAAKAGEWTDITASFKAPKNTYEYLITITTESTNDFAFDDVVITTNENKALFEASAVDGNGLKDVFKGYGFRVGNILNGGTIRNSGITANFLKDYNAIECENETKPDATLVQSGSTDTNIKVKTDSFASIADFASKNGLAFRGHTLVWHSQTPEWFFKEGFNASGSWVSSSTMDKRMESYIKNMFDAFKTQYPDLNLYAYDVCNECISDDSNRTKNNGGAREPGYGNGKSPWVQVYGGNGFIEKAFKYARQYAPEGCKLYYNDYNEYWDHKRDSIINTILKPLSAKGLLDGMGMQSHVDAGHTTFSGTVNYLKAMDMFLDLGIDVQVSELDISLDSGQSLTDQANKYKNIVEHIVDVNGNNKYPGKVTLFQVWGPNDANTWISGDKSPTLYDKNNQPKSAYTALMNYGKSLKEGPIPSLDGGEVKEPELDSDGYWFHHTFEGKTEGWEGRGAASILTSGRNYYAGAESLLVMDREAEWNGAQFSLPRAFKAGEEYSFSVNFRYEDGDAVTRDFKLTLEYNDGEETTWAEIASGSAGKGQWVQLANTNFKLPANGSSFKLIVETTDGTLDNFYIDEAIGAPAGTKISGAGQPALPADPNKVTPGDTDFDGKITALDMINERLAVLGKITDSAVLKAADVDQSKEVVTADLVLLQEYLLGKIKEFPDNRPPVTGPDVSAMEALFKNISINSSYKKDGENNCLYTQRFGADPGWLVYNDRLYIYTTNDAFEYKNGQMQENSYDVWTINCVSSADLVNWTDHGAIPVAGRRGATNGAASWANNSWAPDAIWKKINGKDKFFLYFADNGSGVGVLTADSPEGPWKDPINKQIISRQTPNCGNVAWLFDPGAYYDPETNEGYIAFGGGKNNDSGTYADPGTGRMLKLTDDCLGIDGSAKTIHPPYLFEDSSLIKIGSNWVYSFCHNWNVPGGTSVNGKSFGNADIGYMIGSNPMGDLSYQGVVFKNTGTQRLDNGGNNHHSIMEFKGKYYVAYHSRQLEMRMGVNGGKGLNYRSPCIDVCSVNGTTLSCTGTIEGVKQLETLDPYKTVQAETMSNQSKSISVSGLGDTKVVAKKGDWIKVSGVKFNGTSKFTAKGKGGAIRVTTGSPTGDVIAYADFSEGSEVTIGTVADVSGTKDIYITFSADNMELDSWSFES